MVDKEINRSQFGYEFPPMPYESPFSFRKKVKQLLTICARMHGQIDFVLSTKNP
jgi:hypothetical protein